MAVDQETRDLINAQIDGLISAEESALLEYRLAGDAEARALRDELRDLCSDLDSVPPLEPPPALHQAILQASRPAGRQASKRKRAGGIQEFLSGLFAMPSVRYASAFAAGAVVTITLVSSDQNSRQAFDDVTSLVGTIGDSGRRELTGPNDSMRLSLNQIAGSVSIRGEGPLMILDFDLASQEPVDIVATFNDRDIWFNGFAQLESRGTSVAAQTGQVTIRMQGQRRYAVYLRNNGQNTATVHLRFAAGGEALYEGDLRFAENK